MKPFSDRWQELVRKAFEPIMRKKDGTPGDFTEVQKEIIEWWVNTVSTIILILGGERSGKSFIASFLAMLCMAPSTDEEHIFWIVGPDYLQARPEWEYLYKAFKAMDLIEGEPSMPAAIAAPWSFKTKLGHHVMTRSSGDIQKLASFSVHGAIMAEGAQQMHEVYLKLLGRLAETGGFLIIVGTLEEGLPWYTDLYERWKADNPIEAKSFSMPMWSNTAVFPGGRNDPAILKLEAENTPDYFMERYGAEPRRTHGRVLPEFSFEQHVRRLSLQEDVPVELAIDPGTTCYAVLFVQHVGLRTYVLDRVYERGTILQEIIPEVMGNPLFKLLIKEKAGVIDQAGAQRPGSYSQVELWSRIAGITLRYRYIFEDDTIRTLRYYLGTNNPLHEPLIYFNDHMTNRSTPQGDALDVLAEPMLWKWRESGYKMNERKRPIDRNNHAMKALGYKLVDQYGVHMEKKRMKAQQRSYWGVPA